MRFYFVRKTSLSLHACERHIGNIGKVSPRTKFRLRKKLFMANNFRLGGTLKIFLKKFRQESIHSLLDES